MQVLVIRLRRTITAAVPRAKHQTVDRRVTESSTRVDNGLAEEVMLLYPRTDKHAP